MVRIPLLLLVFLQGLFLISEKVNGQSNFSGTWIFKSKEHLEGPNYANSLPKEIKVGNKNDSLYIEMATIGNDGKDIISKQVLPTNGKTITIHSEKLNRQLMQTLAMKESKGEIKITVVFSLPENPLEVDFTRIEDWSLSSDKKELRIIRRSEETKGQTWAVNGVFIKKIE